MPGRDHALRSAVGNRGIGGRDGDRGQVGKPAIQRGGTSHRVGNSCNRDAINYLLACGQACGVDGGRPGGTRTPRGRIRKVLDRIVGVSPCSCELLGQAVWNGHRGRGDGNRFQCRRAHADRAHIAETTIAGRNLYVVALRMTGHQAGADRGQALIV